MKIDIFNVKVRVEGGNNEEEELWAARIGMKSVNAYHKIADTILVLAYNRVWRFLYPGKKSFRDFKEDHPNYEVLAEKIEQAFLKAFVFINGGYTRDKIVRVKTLYECENWNEDLGTICIMISIERKRS